jgi:hypothetical protein
MLVSFMKGGVMQPTRISWTQVRARYERRSRSQPHGKASASMIQAFYRGNVADKMMRTWLQDPVTGGMVGLVGDAMEVCEQAHQQEGRSVRWRSAAQRGAVREECVQLAADWNHCSPSWCCRTGGAALPLRGVGRHRDKTSSTGW